MKAAILCNGINWTINKKHYIYIYMYIYTYTFVGCVVLVINNSTTNENNITLFNSQRFEYKLFFR